MLNQFKEKFNIRVFSLQAVQIVRTGSVFLISVFLANVYKDTFIISQYETLGLVSSALTFFWVSGLMTTFLPFYNHADEKKRKAVIFNTFISLSIISVLSSVLIFMTGIIFFKTITYKLFLVYSAFMLFNSPTFLIEYIFLVKNENNKLLIYSIVSFSLQVFALCFPLIMGLSLLSALFYLTIYTFLRFLYLVFLIHKYASFMYQKDVMFAHLKKSTPIMFSLLVGGSTEIVNGFVVRYFTNSNDFAIFRYGAREFPLVRLLANAMSVVLSGEIANALLKNELKSALHKLKQGSARLMHILFPLTLVLLVISKPMFKFLFTDVFIDSYQIFNVYLLLIVSRLFFPQTILFGMQKNTKILEASIVEFVVNIVLAIIFVLLFGIIGVPFATLIAYYTNQFLIYLYVRKMGIKISEYTPVKLWLVYSIVCWIVFILI